MIWIFIAGLFAGHLYWRFTGKHAKFVITGGDGTPYMTRYTLFAFPFLGALRVHHFHRGDEDACLHDHPWSFISLILKGGYYEWTEPMQGVEARHWYGPGHVLFRPASWKHRVELRAGCEAWTLVWTFGRQRRWGFWTRKHGWVHWRAFLASKQRGANWCEDR